MLYQIKAVLLIFVLMVHCLYSTGQSRQGVVVLDSPDFPYVFELDSGDSHVVVRTYNGKEVKKKIKLVSVKLLEESNYALPPSVLPNNFYQCKIEVEIDGKQVEVYHRPYQMPVTLEGLRIYVENIRRWDETALFEKCGDMSKEVRISVCMEDEPWGPQDIVFPISDYVWRSSVYNNTWSALVPFNTLYYHRGEDYGAIPDRLNVVSPVDGVITASPLPSGDGQSNAIYVVGDNGLRWRLSHMNTESIKPECLAGNRVQAGTVLGKTGMTWAGRKSQKNDPHLHVGIDFKGIKLASFPYLMEAYMRRFPDTVFAIAGGYRFAVAGKTVELDARRSFSRDGQPIKSFQWKLSNGEIVKRAKTKIVYDRPGIYAEELLVESGVGAQDRDFLYVKVFDSLVKQEYAAGWAYYYPLRGIKPGTEVLFWNRLDNTTAEVKINFGDSDDWYPIEKEITHTYDHPGRYIVTLRSAGPAGEPVMLKMEVLVESSGVR